MTTKRATIENAYPLHWPDGVPRTKYRKRSRFGIVSLGIARDELLHELRLLGARYVVLSTNAPTKRDGYFYADARNPDDPGVAVYFDLDGAQRVIACDAWIRMVDNVQALAKTVAGAAALVGDVAAALADGHVTPEEHAKIRRRADALRRELAQLDASLDAAEVKKPEPPANTRKAVVGL